MHVQINSSYLVSQHDPPTYRLGMPQEVSAQQAAVEISQCCRAMTTCRQTEMLPADNSQTPIANRIASCLLNDVECRRQTRLILQLSMTQHQSWAALMQPCLHCMPHQAPAQQPAAAFLPAMLQAKQMGTAFSSQIRAGMPRGAGSNSQKIGAEKSLLPVQLLLQQVCPHHSFHLCRCACIHLAVTALKGPELTPALTAKVGMGSGKPSCSKVSCTNDARYYLSDRLVHHACIGCTNAFFVCW